jgi:hypothetical protein
MNVRSDGPYDGRIAFPKATNVPYYVLVIKLLSKQKQYVTVLSSVKVLAIHLVHDGGLLLNADLVFD